MLHLPFALLARAGALLLLLASAAAAEGATLSASVKANAVKPLTLTKVQDLDLGMVTLGPGAWTNATVSLAQSGAFTCTNPNLVCTGATKVAQYNVTGSKQQQVNVSAPNVTLVDQNDTTQTLTLVTDAPASVVLPNSGAKGVTFSIGGSVTLASTTAAGTYVGTFNVTVDY